MAWGVIFFYVGLAVLVGLLILGVRGGWNKRAWLPFFIFGIAMTVFVNGRYLTDGVVGGITFFVGIFDVVVNIGANANERAAVVTTCANNACTVWDNTYTLHPTWAIAFYQRFASAPAFRLALLYGHIAFNTIALVLVTLQIMRPGRVYAGHKAMGRIAFVSLFISMVCAGWLASELSGISQYGGIWFELGLFGMIFLVLGSAVMGVAAIVRGDAVQHRVWMWRFAGGLWGSYWIFRAEMLVVDLLVRDTEGLTLTIASWTSVPLGIVIGEFVRRRQDASPARALEHKVPLRSASVQ